MAEHFETIFEVKIDFYWWLEPPPLLPALFCWTLFWQTTTTIRVPRRIASQSVGKRRKEEAWESTINNHHRMYAGLCKYGFLGILLSVSFEGRMLKNFSN